MVFRPTDRPQIIKNQTHRGLKFDWVLESILAHFFSLMVPQRASKRLGWLGYADCTGDQRSRHGRHMARPGLAWPGMGRPGRPRAARTKPSLAQLAQAPFADRADRAGRASRQGSRHSQAGRHSRHSRHTQSCKPLAQSAQSAQSN